MADLYLLDFGGDDEERARRDAERAAERARIRDGYVTRVVAATGVDASAAERAVAAIFDHTYPGGRPCLCGCHPQLSATHGDGMDCPCGWDEARRAAARAKWTAWRDSDASRELAAAHAAEDAAIVEWISGQVGVEATRTTSYAPEQWEGTIDGHSFYFRERHGEWRIELDLEPNGRFAKRFVGVDENGEAITEPVELTEGQVIADGLDSRLGETPVEHLEFIVRTVRDHLWGQQCDHAGALFFCPKCGERITQPR